MGPIDNLTRKWTIFLVHHTHVDIGYTEPQAVILRKHPEFIAKALDYCRETDHLPAGERFCWTCEVSWTVRAFLQRYPERREEFFARVREGRIEVTGLYLQLTDLFTEELLDYCLGFASDLAENEGFEIVTAMNDDVNGWAWGLPKLMSDRGIRYFDTAINETRSLGVRPRPRPFYWASPGGERVLMWHGPGYLHGNCLFQNPNPEQSVASFLKGLEDSGYPHDAVEVRIHGENHDNAPPGLWISGMVHDWNSRCDQVNIKLVTARTWFEEIEQNWAEDVPELRLAWPDWWADGNGSALYESSIIRAAQADILTAEALHQAGCSVDPEQIERARESAMFFCEHTWGAWNSSDDPDSLGSRAQWNHKAGYAYDAASEVQGAIKTALRSARSSAGVPIVSVFNPLPWARTDIAEVTVLDELVTPGKTSWVPGPVATTNGPEFYLVDVETEEQVSVVRRPTIGDSARRPAQLVTFVARDVPACGWKQYRIVPGQMGQAAAEDFDSTTLESSQYRLRLDPVSGALNSLFDVESGIELVRCGQYGLNQCIYETVNHPDGRQRICRWEGIQKDTPFTHRTPELMGSRVKQTANGVVLTTEAVWEHGMKLETEYRLYDELRRLDIVNTLTKQPTDDAEAIYHAFPFAAEPPTVYLDTPGAVMRPGLDQVSGTATDWHSIQHYFAVAGDDFTAAVTSPDVPLVQVNGINTGKWQETLPPPNGLVMSWVMNNYWFTNFPARQGGRITYRYSITEWAGQFNAARAGRFSREVRQSLLAVVL